MGFIYSEDTQLWGRNKLHQGIETSRMTNWCGLVMPPTATWTHAYVFSWCGSFQARSRRVSEHQWHSESSLWSSRKHLALGSHWSTGEAMAYITWLQGCVALLRAPLRMSRDVTWTTSHVSTDMLDMTWAIQLRQWITFEALPCITALHSPECAMVLVELMVCRAG